MLLSAASSEAYSQTSNASKAESSDASELSDDIVEMSFLPTDMAFPNPERGFYRSVGTLDELDISRVEAAYNEGFRLLYVKINLDAFRETEISNRYLKKLDKGFKAAREGGVKLIVRAAYNYPRGETGYQNAKDASLAQVQLHTSQLKHLYEKNVDVIAYVQAGYVGAWGEWHTSSNDLVSDINRGKVKDAILDSVPSNRFVQFRYPPYIQEWVSDVPTPQTAVKENFRIGFHNDCFLASDTDVGTYSENEKTRAAERKFTKKLASASPFGGETCKPADAPGSVPRTSCQDILSEGAQFKLTYLNAGYYRPLFHDNWSEQGCLESVRTKMGYRFSLSKAAHSQSVKRGDSLNIAISLENSGWARLYNPRPVEIILINQSDNQLAYRIVASGADPRLWLPDNNYVNVLNIPIPAQLETGSYSVSLSLPDMNPDLRNDGRFAVRLANSDNPEKGQVWNPVLGSFSLGTFVNVTD